MGLKELPSIGGPSSAPAEYADIDHGHDYVPITAPNVDIAAIHTFRPRFADSPPFNTISDGLVENLNADLLDGFHATYFATDASIVALELRVAALEVELAKLTETNDLLRRILAEVTKQRISLGEATDTRLTDEDVKEVWQ